MMNKKYYILIIISLFFFLNIDVYAKNPNTIAEYRQELDKLKKEKAIYEGQKQKKQSEIKQNQNNVKAANDEIVQAQNKVTNLSNEIDSNEEKIKNLENEISELLILYQKLSNENIYVKYATGATSMTELIMRIDAISQVTGYNNKKIDDIEQLIVSNKKMQKELTKYQSTLNDKISTYENNIQNLGVEL